MFSKVIGLYISRSGSVRIAWNRGDHTPSRLTSPAELMSANLRFFPPLPTFYGLVKTFFQNWWPTTRLCVMFIASGMRFAARPKMCLFYTTGGFGSFFQTRRFFCTATPEPTQNPSVKLTK